MPDGTKIGHRSWQKGTPMTDFRRITLIAREPRKAQRDWDFTNPAGNRIVFVDSLAFLPYAIDQGMKEAGHDIQRVVIDRTGTPVQFLELLATLPAEFGGDVLYTSGDGKNFLSSVARGDGRLLYSLTDEDLQFYLQTNSLTWQSFPGELRAPQYAMA